MEHMLAEDYMLILARKHMCKVGTDYSQIIFRLALLPRNLTRFTHVRLKNLHLVAIKMASQLPYPEGRL